jgi:hypothetical protein
VGPAAQRDCAASNSNRNYQQPGERPSDQILLVFNRGRRRVAFIEGDCNSRTR